MKLAIDHHVTRVNQESDYIFGRREFAQNLKNIFTNTTGGFVLAIDATWGEGKTSFIHQLIHDLKDTEGLIPIYYDAFSNDFSSDTFLSIGATIAHEVELHFDKIGKQSRTKTQIDHLKSVTKSTALELVKLGTNLGLKSLTAGLIQSSDLEKIASNAFTSATFGTLALDLNEKYKAYENARSNINSYIKTLESISNNNEKVIFFIDELDRCRPNFAVEVLEKVKHLFPAKNVIFVISYNKSQLSKIISNVYGASPDDSLKYLEKFIHIEANLPIADSEQATNSYGKLFDSFMGEFEIVVNYDEIKLHQLKEMFILLCSSNSLKMNSREIERAFSYISFCFAALSQDKGVELFEYFLPAAMIKVKNRSLFEQLKSGKFNSFGGDNNTKWMYEFFKKYYYHTLKLEASNIYYVKGFKEACDIVSMFKLPTDDE
ncbi:KAP family P-loop NTPase fold protein [Aliivibrio sifiae]|uniref:KAP family P-loop NTPase fold protein n=1 Tax=Aliivibrio sifiae TaxID=566293 RepID=UPI003D13DC0B